MAEHLILHLLIAAGWFDQTFAGLLLDFDRALGTGATGAPELELDAAAANAAAGGWFLKIATRPSIVDGCNVIAC